MFATGRPAVRNLPCLARGRHLVKQDDELVATEAGRRILRPEAPSQPIGKRDKQAVPSPMAEPVGDQLQVVQIDKQDGDAPELAIGTSEGSLQTIGEQAAGRRVCCHTV